MSTNFKAKVTVFKLLELAYSTDEGFTKKLILSGDSFSLSVDKMGNAKLTGNAGSLFFSGKPAL